METARSAGDETQLWIHSSVRSHVGNAFKGVSGSVSGAMMRSRALQVVLEGLQA